MLDQNDEANTLHRQMAHPWNVFLSNEGSSSLSSLPWISVLWEWHGRRSVISWQQAEMRAGGATQSKKLHCSITYWSCSLQQEWYMFFSLTGRVVCNLLYSLSIVYSISWSVCTVETAEAASYIDVARYTSCSDMILLRKSRCVEGTKENSCRVYT